MPTSASELLAALPRLCRYARLLTGDRARADELVERSLAQANQVHRGRGDLQLGGVTGIRLLALLLRLPVEQREVMLLVAVERMAYDEISALLEVPVATVVARLLQARRQLRSSTCSAAAVTNGEG
ncbi:MAG: sigma factor-like helix-turn-helix DNA-binding protein [Casimicrobiaceae bacterium]